MVFTVCPLISGEAKDLPNTVVIRHTQGMHSLMKELLDTSKAHTTALTGGWCRLLDVCPLTRLYPSGIGAVTSPDSPVPFFLSSLGLQHGELRSRLRGALYSIAAHTNCTLDGEVYCDRLRALYYCQHRYTCYMFGFCF